MMCGVECINDAKLPVAVDVVDIALDRRSKFVAWTMLVEEGVFAPIVL